jgi:hypothetical protein
MVRPGSRGELLIAVLVVLCAAVVAVVYVCSAQSLPVVVSESDLDLGRLPPSAEHIVYLPLHNPTFRTAAIEAIHVSCGCTRIHPSRLVLKPWQRAELKLTLDLAERAALATESDFAQGMLPFDVTLTPEIDLCPLGEVEWTLRGEIDLVPGTTVSAR